MAIPAGLLEGINNLDPLPVTAQQLTQAISDEDVSVNEIARIIEYDQAIASNILRVANSALYGGQFPVDEIRGAVVRLGTNTILSIVLDDHMKKLRIHAPMYDLSENDLWLHGAVASLAVQEIQREATKAEIPRVASIAALVHDLGKLIIVRYMKVDMRQLLDRCEEKKITFVEAEREIMGCDHAEVGGAIARRWKFPEEITRAVELHHQVPVAEPTPILDAVMIANLIAKTLGIGLGAEGMNFEVDPGCSRRLGLSFSAFCRACAATNARVAALREAYGVTDGAETGSPFANAA
jgi:HD-like signal output (HDOD) protein